MFDPEKPVQTRDGRKARIICTNAKSSCPIVALVQSNLEPDIENIMAYYPTGQENSTYERLEDLINIPEKRWAVLLDDFTWIQTYSAMSPGEIIPVDRPNVKCIACLEFTEGDGLGWVFENCTFSNDPIKGVKV